MHLEKLILKNLFKFHSGNSFVIRFWDGEELRVGEGEILAKIQITQPLKKKDFLTSASLALGEAYMERSIDIEGDLYIVLDAILKSVEGIATDIKALPKIFHKSTSRKKQKEEVSSHYDLGNDFYSLWLDETLMYSCGYFKDEKDTLYDAQMNKVHHILKKLQLQPGHTLLDIGCGWGTLLIEAAKTYGVKGVGITLSEEQHKKFGERIREEKLENLLEVRLMDYRDLEKSHLLFDRVVSVGMLEHVGRPNYEVFFHNVDSVLKEEGIFVLHYISSLTESEGDAWIKKYIFPGGVIPSLREMISVSADFKYYVLDVESLRVHYTKTLLEWYKNFENNLPKIREMFDEKFIRMWAIYLCSCAAGFNNGIVDLHQIIFTKGVNNKLPLTRNYLYE